MKSQPVSERMSGGSEMDAVNEKVNLKLQDADSALIPRSNSGEARVLGLGLIENRYVRIGTLPKGQELSVL